MRTFLVFAAFGALACGGGKASDDGADGGATSAGGTTVSSTGSDAVSDDATSSAASSDSGSMTPSGTATTGSATTTSAEPPEQCGDPYFYHALCGDCATDGMCTDGSPCFQTMYDGLTWGGCAPQCGGLVECPDAPATGTAMAVCRPDPNFDAVCVLQCTTPGEQAECPDGMTCVEARTPDYGIICAFPP